MPGPRLIRRRPHAAWLLAAAAAAVLTMLAACTSSRSPASAPSPATQLDAAVAYWASFPASAATRPLVVEAGADVSGAYSFTSAPARNAVLAAPLVSTWAAWFALISA